MTQNFCFGAALRQKKFHVYLPRLHTLREDWEQRIEIGLERVKCGPANLLSPPPPPQCIPYIQMIGMIVVFLGVVLVYFSSVVQANSFKK